MKEHDIIHLKGMEFFSFHGVLPEEKRLGQRFIVDVDLFTDFRKAARSGQISDTVNYAEVYELVRFEVEKTCYDLLESLAESIAAKILEEFNCRAVRVELHKPNAPISGIFRDVSVEVVRERIK